MARRYHETPMDFEYQNGTGPVDGRSPFAQLSMNSQRFPATPGGTKKSVLPPWITVSTKQSDGTDSAGSGNAGGPFDSPTRQPQAGPGASRTTSPTKALPPVPAWNGLFNTPRKTTAMEIDDSSAGETPKSPERQDDSEAGTPAETMVQARRKLVEMDTRSAPVLPTLKSLNVSPSKEKREVEWERERRPPSSSRKESIFGRIKNKFNSPGRGEIPRADLVQSKERRVRKSKSRDAQRQLARQRRYSMSNSGSDAENDDSELPTQHLQLSPRKRTGNHRPPPESQDHQQPPPSAREPHWISSLFTFIGAHPTVPHILSFYAQFAFNLSLLLIFLYVIYSAWSNIQGDIDKRAFEASADILAEMATCTRHWKVNECEKVPLAPALEGVCSNWAKCMNQDATKIARAKVSAGTFAEIYNSFIEPISYKAMIFTAIFVFGGIAVSNLAFGYVRHRAPSEQSQQAWQFQQPPPTPQRTFSGAEMQGYYGALGGQPGTPWHQPVQGLEPAPSGVGMIEGRGSPVRRLQYN